MWLTPLLLQWLESHIALWLHCLESCGGRRLPTCLTPRGTENLKHVLSWSSVSSWERFSCVWNELSTQPNSTTIWVSATDVHFPSHPLQHFPSRKRCFQRSLPAFWPHLSQRKGPYVPREGLVWRNRRSEAPQTAVISEFSCVSHTHNSQALISIKLTELLCFGLWE